MWGFDRFNQDFPLLSKHLFESARESAYKHLIENTLDNLEEISLYTTNSPKNNPFDPQKLQNPAGAIYEIDLPQARQFYEEGRDHHRPIGFRS